VEHVTVAHEDAMNTNPVEAGHDRCNRVTVAEHRGLSGHTFAAQGLESQQNPGEVRGRW
jgi:hypothetical protein